jgi:signal transduction histidine kinase
MNYENKPTILHVDDDEANRFAVKRILEKSGFEVIEAALGQEGINLAKKCQPELIILDIKLPDINGFDVCRIIKKDSEIKSIPVLQTSASFVSSEHKVTGLDSGADGYLAQPIESAVLVATVKSLLRIRNAEKKAHEAARAREEILAIVSHDLRNPLSFIMLQTKVMERQLLEEKLSATELAFKMKKINNSCLKMNRMIQDILDVSSVDQGNLRLVKTKFPIGQLMKDVITYNEEMALQSEISLLLNINELEDEIIDADYDRLQQVLGNLISNSLKFTPSGGRIEITIENKNKFILFSVKDSGSGISAKDLPHVFNRYWQGHPERKSGYGIGLSIVSGITEAHGGQVDIESKENEGTRVTFCIPHHLSDA